MEEQKKWHVLQKSTARGYFLCLPEIPQQLLWMWLGSRLWPCTEVPACWWHSEPSVGVPFIPRSARSVPVVPPDEFG